MILIFLVASVVIFTKASASGAPHDPKGLNATAGFLLTVGADAQTLDGGKLGTQVVWNLNTVPPPGVVSSNPVNGDTNAQGGSLALVFASPMDIKTIASRVVFTPPLKNQNNFNYDDKCCDTHGVFCTY